LACLRSSLITICGQRLTGCGICRPSVVDACKLIAIASGRLLVAYLRGQWSGMVLARPGNLRGSCVPLQPALSAVEAYAGVIGIACNCTAIAVMNFVGVNVVD